MFRVSGCWVRVGGLEVHDLWEYTPERVRCTLK